MYHAVVRRQVRKVFAQLSTEAWEATLAPLAEDVHHVFPGDHPLGGERRTREAVRRWFERLHRLFPEHEFRVHRVIVSGWPWNTWAVAQWTGRLRPQSGDEYTNEGTHWIHIRWGRVRAFHAYLDTQRVARECERMAALGVEEAAAAPIGD